VASEPWTSTENVPAACGTCEFTESTGMTGGDRVKAYTKVQPFIDTNLEDTKRMFPNGISADPQIVADEIVRTVDLAKGTRPRRDRRRLGLRSRNRERRG
jgi:hypothetical protein